MRNWGTGRFPKPFLVGRFPLVFARVRSERIRGRAAVLERNYVETIVREAGCHVPLHAGYDDLSEKAYGNFPLKQRTRILRPTAVHT